MFRGFVLSGLILFDGCGWGATGLPCSAMIWKMPRAARFPGAALGYQTGIRSSGWNHGRHPPFQDGLCQAVAAIDVAEHIEPFRELFRRQRDT